MSSRFGNSNKTLPKQHTNPKPYAKLAAQSVEMNTDAEYELGRPAVSVVFRLRTDSFLNLAEKGVLFVEGRSRLW